MKILLLEDDKKISVFIVKALSESGFAVSCAYDGREGLRIARSEPFDLAIIDISLPFIDGVAIVENIRKANINSPVIFLSGRDAVTEKVRALQAGGDVYLTKPFSVCELIANIRAQLRRANGGTQTTILKTADLSLDLVRCKVERAGIPIDLQPREFTLLEYLMRNAGRIVTKTMLMEHVWNYNCDPQTNIIETRIYKLREKIDKPFSRPLLQTIRGIGYMLEK